MAKLGFYFDATRCIGCHTCQIQCKDKNRLMEPGIIVREVHTYETGEFPNPFVYNMAVTCNHCEDPACVHNCPTTAMHIADDSTVQYDQSLCVGCRMCVMSCPYGHPKFNEETGFIEKCDACIAFRQHDKNPACVDACIMRALDFGDLDELREKHDYNLVSELPCYPDGGTKPKVLIRTKDCMFEDSFRNVIL